MGKTSFQSIEQLSKHISAQIDLLNAGQLNLQDIEKLTECSKDLYERLIVIRHKAYEKMSISSTHDNDTAPPLEKIETPVNAIKEEEPIFDLSSDTTIEKKESVMMTFDFSEPEEDNESAIDTLEVDTPSIEQTAVLTSIEPEPEHYSESLNDSHADTSSLNDSFTENKSGSLADSLNQSSIKDLKNHIGINKKFSFITNLFDGSNEDYNEAINALNNCLDGDQARSILGDIAKKNNWNVENETVTSFLDLVERRYS